MWKSILLTWKEQLMASWELDSLIMKILKTLWSSSFISSSNNSVPPPQEWDMMSRKDFELGIYF